MQDGQPSTGFGDLVASQGLGKMGSRMKKDLYLLATRSRTRKRPT